MRWSDYQESIFDFVENKSKGLSIQAVAGSGKTTTIIECLSRIPRGSDTIFLAFNKAIAKEISKKAPAGIEVKTFNALGHRVLCKDRTFNPDKLKELFGEVLPNHCYTNFKAITRLTKVAKANGLIPEFDGSDKLNRPLRIDKYDKWKELLETYSIDAEIKNNIPAAEIIEHARGLLIASLKKSEEFDFDDQIYFPFAFKLKLNTYEHVFVDEAQDVSNIQHYLLNQLLLPWSRLIAVGDPNQAIYGFRGAHTNSMEALEKRFKLETLPLSISYRCPVKVIKEAQALVPTIYESNDAPEGLVQYHPDIPKSETFKDRDMILCRLNSPLIDLAIKFMKDNIPFDYRGRDFSTELDNLIASSSTKDIKKLSEKITAFIEKLKGIEAPDEKHKEMLDYCKALDVFIRLYTPKDADQLREFIKEFFRDVSSQNKGVILSTIHRAKGLESDRVYYLGYNLESKAKAAWQRQQELNLKYVAITRAKKELHMIRLDD